MNPTGAPPSRSRDSGPSAAGAPAGSALSLRRPAGDGLLALAVHGGTAELSEHVIAAMEGRNGCLLANHGMIVAGPDLTRAMWLAGELEALAHQYYHALAIGGGHILTDAQIADTAKSFESYGIRSEEPS